jgi:hypothetical protein
LNDVQHHFPHQWMHGSSLRPKFVLFHVKKFLGSRQVFDCCNYDTASCKRRRKRPSHEPVYAHRHHLKSFIDLLETFKHQFALMF